MKARILYILLTTLFIAQLLGCEMNTVTEADIDDEYGVYFEDYVGADGAEVTVTGVYTLDESLMDQGIMMSYLAECAVE